MPCSLTLLGLAAQNRQPAAAEWLLQHGASFDVVAAWDLGWRERAARRLVARPDLATQRIGLEGATLLHLAVRRNDLELLRLLLSACPDLEIRDAAFRSTPLGWAKYLGRAERIVLLGRYQTNSG